MTVSSGKLRGVSLERRRCLIGNDQTEARLVVFRLADRAYALSVENVGKILPMVALTPVPEGPTWLEGVLNLRGQVVPVVDLRARFGLSRRPVSLDTPLVIAEAGDRTAGLIVDTVDEVLRLPRGSLSPPGELVQPSGLVGSVAAIGDRVILVLDPELLLASSEPFVPAEM
jgi:purine-binding chemotaxis protein CheW